MKIFTFIVALILMLPLSVFAQETVVPIPFKSSWKYLDNGSDQGTAWQKSGFDDSGWKAGNAKLGYDYSDIATTVSYGPDSKNKFVTTYFRKTFSIADISSYTSFTIKAHRDDAFVIYVNGKEVFRDNLPDGDITYTTFASGSSSASKARVKTLSPSAFQSGDNVIAVEVHQQKPSSSDLAFDMELSAEKSASSNLAPSVSITSPADNSDHTVNQTVTINASASDPEEALTKVEFYVNNSKIGEDASSPYSIDWTPNSTGAYTLTAKATDQGGLSATSAAVTVNIKEESPTDVTPPTVESINRHSPTTEVTSATSVTYRVTFSEKVTGVDKADFTLTTVSGTAKGTLASDAVASVGTEGRTYDVTVSSITGEGVLRLDLNSSGTGIIDAANNAITSGYTSGQSYNIQPISDYGFVSVTGIEPLPINKHTAEKPQSKVWKHAGKWWTVLPDSDGTYIWRLDGTAWTKTLLLASTSSTRADCKVVGNVVHALLFREGSTSYLLSAEYVESSGTYKLWSQRTARVSLNLESYAETATIDVDGKGRMWMATDGENTVNVRWSDAPYSQWSSPITLASNIMEDDICAVIALPGKIGVLWSDQTTERFGFKTHLDGAAPDDWSSDEIPASQSALNIGKGMADDHLNMALANDGTLYCAVKTGYDTPGYSKVALLVRRPSGTWDDLYTVTDTEGTRPIVILNEELGKLKVIYTETETGGDILYKESSTSNITFGARKTLFTGGDYNYATSTKQTYGPDVVIIVTNESGTRRAESVLASDAANPQVAAALAPATPLPNDIGQGNNLFAYPNPFSSKTTLNFTPVADGEYSISLYNSRGAKVKELQQGKAKAGQVREVEIDGSNLANGLYIVRMQSGNEAKTIRLLFSK